MTDTDLVILGAGPAGLGAALRAARQGVRTTVLEREDHVGGASASFELAGQRVDLGSHRLHRATAPDVLEVLQELLGDDLQVRPRLGRIRLAERWIGFPLTPAGVATSLPPAFAARATVDALTSPLRSAAEDTFDEVVRAGLGDTMADRFYGPYARKLWGLGPEELAGEQARVRISASDPLAILKRVVQGSDPAARTFRYPRRGFGQISEALAEAAADAGANIRLGTTATSLAPGQVDTADGTLTTATTFSTIPLPVLSRLWHDTPPEVTDAAGSLASRAMVLAYLVLDLPRYTRFDAHYLPEGWTPVTRVSEPKNYRDNPEDPVDRTVLCAEIPCQVGDSTWNADDEQLGRTVVEALERSGLPEVPVAQVASRRLPSAYPVYRVGYERPLAVLDRWASQLERTLTFGRQGLFVHDNSHHALAMAWAAVDVLDRDGTIDRDAWARARETFAEHVVED